MKFNLFFLVLIALTLSACATPLTPEQQAKNERMDKLFREIDENYVPVSYVSISCSGHTDIPVTGYSIQDLVSTREYGSGGCGGTVAAGYPLPKQWRPGMKVRVSWKLDGKPWRETATNIMRYDEPGMVFIHIFNNDQVRVVSSARYSSESPKHPISGESKNPPPEEQQS